MVKENTDRQQIAALGETQTKTLKDTPMSSTIYETFFGTPRIEISKDKNNENNDTVLDIFEDNVGGAPIKKIRAYAMDRIENGNIITDPFKIVLNTPSDFNIVYKNDDNGNLQLHIQLKAEKEE